MKLPGKGVILINHSVNGVCGIKTKCNINMDWFFIYNLLHLKHKQQITYYINGLILALFLINFKL